MLSDQNRNLIGRDRETYKITAKDLNRLLDAARAEGAQSAEAALAEALGALKEIADGRVEAEQAGHYNAHRKCVTLARETISRLSGEG